MDRAEAYREAGADVLFIEAPENQEQMRMMNTRFRGRAPLLANMVEGGKTPLLSADALQCLGYSVVIFPGGTVRAISFVIREYMTQLKETGSTAEWRDRMFDFNGFNSLIGTPELLALGQQYDASRISQPDLRKK